MVSGPITSFQKYYYPSLLIRRHKSIYLAGSRLNIWETDVTMHNQFKITHLILWDPVPFALVLLIVRLTGVSISICRQ